ncbi:hypothetical protein BN946_scf184912.g50 [Trametes cinnabarina]|uniref:DUF6532 domain-containing protein n=1 Tax=Pycnoporus cinnabarinus TaxID=5643 RepID=A0A060STS6_PYCCI|nr:hypothetical protein BN946_scf184912.g50 [Trametes cinnabarina]
MRKSKSKALEKRIWNADAPVKKAAKEAPPAPCKHSSQARQQNQVLAARQYRAPDNAASSSSDSGEDDQHQAAKTRKRTTQSSKKGRAKPESAHRGHEGRTPSRASPGSEVPKRVKSQLTSPPQSQKHFELEDEVVDNEDSPFESGVESSDHSNSSHVEQSEDGENTESDDDLPEKDVKKLEQTLAAEIPTWTHVPEDTQEDEGDFGMPNSEKKGKSQTRDKGHGSRHDHHQPPVSSSPSPSPGKDDFSPARKSSSLKRKKRTVSHRSDKESASETPEHDGKGRSHTDRVVHRRKKRREVLGRNDPAGQPVVSQPPEPRPVVKAAAGKRQRERDNEEPSHTGKDHESDENGSEDERIDLVYKKGSRLGILEQCPHVKKTLNAAIFSCQADLLLRNAFPDGAEKYNSLARTALIRSAEELGYKALVKRLKVDDDYAFALAAIPVDRIPLFRSRARDAISGAVRTTYNLTPGNSAHVNWLLKGCRYIYPHDYQIFAAIDDHRGNPYEASEFTTNFFGTAYSRNMRILSALKDGSLEAYHDLMHDLFNAVCGRGIGTNNRTGGSDDDLAFLDIRPKARRARD